MDEERKRKAKTILLIILLLMFTGTFIGYMRYKIMYDLAIKQGAENVVTALQMVIACQTLSNVSIEDIKRETIEMFILNDVDNS